jgi:hypothetical protein
MKLIAPDPEVRIRMPYEYTAKALLTDNERRFYDCLAQITDSRCRIQIKPRLADVFEHEKVNGAFQMISQKHVDFLICRNDDWMPMLGIELDDASHQRADRRERDMFVNNLFASTGVPLLRLPVGDLDNLEKLVAELTRAWHRRWKTLEMGAVPAP